MKKVTSMTVLTTAEGKRLSITFSRLMKKVISSRKMRG